MARTQVHRVLGVAQLVQEQVAAPLVGNLEHQRGHHRVALGQQRVVGLGGKEGRREWVQTAG